MQTRELSRRLGVSQPLLYRYFPSKQDLINAVFEAVFMSQWRDDWISELQDRSVPLRDRLLPFTCNTQAPRTGPNGSASTCTPAWLTWT